MRSDCSRHRSMSSTTSYRSASCRPITGPGPATVNSILFRYPYGSGAGTIGRSSKGPRPPRRVRHSRTCRSLNASWAG